MLARYYFILRRLHTVIKLIILRMEHYMKCNYFSCQPSTYNPAETLQKPCSGDTGTLWNFEKITEVYINCESRMFYFVLYHRYIYIYSYGVNYTGIHRIIMLYQVIVTINHALLIQYIKVHTQILPSLFHFKVFHTDVIR